MNVVEQEILQAAVNGVHEYLRSTRGANALGADADVHTILPDTIEIVHKDGVMQFKLVSIR